MTTTVTTGTSTTKASQRHLPLGAAAAVAAVIVGAGALGLVVTQGQDTATQAPVEQHFPTNADYQQYWEHFSGKPVGAENATVAEHSLQAAGSAGGGASFRHFHPSIRHFHTY
jgi:hypothetical protein